MATRRPRPTRRRDFLDLARVGLGLPGADHPCVLASVRQPGRSPDELGLRARLAGRPLRACELLRAVRRERRPRAGRSGCNRSPRRGLAGQRATYRGTPGGGRRLVDAAVDVPAPRARRPARDDGCPQPWCGFSLLRLRLSRAQIATRLAQPAARRVGCASPRRVAEPAVTLVHRCASGSPAVAVGGDHLALTSASRRYRADRRPASTVTAAARARCHEARASSLAPSTARRSQDDQRHAVDLRCISCQTGAGRQHDGRHWLRARQSLTTGSDPITCTKAPATTP